MLFTDDDLEMLERLKKPGRHRRGGLFRLSMGMLWDGVRWITGALIERIPGGGRGKRALLWALVIHVIVLIIGAFIVALPGESDLPEIIAEVVTTPVSVDLEMTRLSAVKQLSQARPDASAAAASVIRAETEAVMAAPEVTTDGITPVGIGLGEVGLGFGLGSGAGGGGMTVGKIPATMRGRCIPGERARLLHENGGTPEVEAAVVKSLVWLKDRQNVELGHWGSQYRAAMTGLALLCYLGHCETTKSPTYGETVAKGLVHLIETAKRNQGRIGNIGNQHWTYEHAIATYALGEALVISRAEGTEIPDLEEVHKRAVQVIIRGQNPDGGWVYGYTGKGSGDLSVTGWQVQALRAAAHAQVDVPGLDAAMRKTRSLIAGRQGPLGGFGYRQTEDKYSLTGVGILGLQLLGNPGKGELQRGFDYFFQGGPFSYNTESCDLYAWYYMTQAAFNQGGKPWETWNAAFRDEILLGQDRDGSWAPEGSGKSDQAGEDSEIYRSCLSTLMLEVYYRYLPATGRIN